MDRQFRVASRCELLPYLIGLPLGLSRKEVKDLLRFRAATVKGKPALRHDTVLMPGDVVTIAATRKPTRAAALDRHGLAIVHLDDAVAVVEKPAGLLSMGSEREKEKTAYRILNTHLKEVMKTRAQQIFIVHRLDRETSGLMLFARTESAQAALQRNWKGVTKRYLAVVEGVPADAQGTLTDRLSETRSLMVRTRRSGRRAGDHALPPAAHERGQVAARMHARDRTPQPDPRATCRAWPSGRRRPQIWREERSRPPARTARVRAQFSPSGFRRADGVSQFPAAAAQRARRRFGSRQRDLTLKLHGW